MIELIKEILFGVNDPNQQQAIIPYIMAAAAIGKMAMGYDWGGKRKAAALEAKNKYEAQKKEYKNKKITNPYAKIENSLKNMENTMEDVTVNQQQAEFERNMFQQSQANTMQSLRGAAGGSGVAGLAQAMSNQAMTQSQKASASIGAQEARNNMAKAKEQARLNTLEGQSQIQIDTNAAQGEVARQSAEMSRNATLMGMEAQSYQGAQQAQMQGKQMMAEGIGDLGTSLASMGGPDASGLDGDEMVSHYNKETGKTSLVSRAEKNRLMYG
jgi:hypothetical protein